MWKWTIACGIFSVLLFQSEAALSDQGREAPDCGPEVLVDLREPASRGKETVKLDCSPRLSREDVITKKIIRAARHPA